MRFRILVTSLIRTLKQGCQTHFHRGPREHYGGSKGPVIINFDVLCFENAVKWRFYAAFRQMLDNFELCAAPQGWSGMLTVFSLVK